LSLQINEAIKKGNELRLDGFELLQGLKAQVLVEDIGNSLANFFGSLKPVAFLLVLAALASFLQLPHAILELANLQFEVFFEGVTTELSVEPCASAQKRNREAGAGVLLGARLAAGSIVTEGLAQALQKVHGSQYSPRHTPTTCTV